MWVLCTTLDQPSSCLLSELSHSSGDGWLSSQCARGFTVKLNINDIMVMLPPLRLLTLTLLALLLSRGLWTAHPFSWQREWTEVGEVVKNMMLWTRCSGGVCTCTLTHVHVKHITTHLIERSSALHSCLFAALTLQSSAAVVTPIYNWYPQRGMGCLLCLKGSAQRLRILTTSCPCFRGRDDGGGWLLNRGKTCSHPPYCSHTRWPSEQSNVSHSSTYPVRHNLAQLHLLL